jgi:2-methylisocitrate lyase-like PEP mutase family enzyme
MVEKIKVAAEARSDPNFLIVARTDSRTTLGLGEAIKRGKAFEDAGADIIFIESPETTEELQEIGKAFKKPVLANMSNGGKTPILSAADLKEIGFSVGIFPGIGMLTAAAALQSAYTSLLNKGTSENLDVPITELTEMHKLMGFEEVWAFEQKWARDNND